GLHRQGLGVDLVDLAQILHVDEHLAGGVRGGELGLAAELDGAGDLPGLGVDHGGVLRAAVEGEDARGGGGVEDGVGVLAGRLDLAYGGEGLEVEDGDHRAAAVADEAAVEVVGDGDAVDAGGLLYVADRLAAVDVDHRPLS